MHLNNHINKMYLVLTALLLLVTITMFAQTQNTLEKINIQKKVQESTYENTLQQINEQVWYLFYKAYTELDVQIMADIHSNQLIRISGNGQKILDYDTYVKRYETNFEQTKIKGDTKEIALRFFERFYTKDKASERGIYQLIVNKDRAEEKRYYGKFHVILKGENEVWKILMDYDSDENKTIGEADFEAAYHIDNIEVFSIVED